MCTLLNISMKDLAVAGERRVRIFVCACVCVYMCVRE